MKENRSTIRLKEQRSRVMGKIKGSVMEAKRLKVEGEGSDLLWTLLRMNMMMRAVMKGAAG
jgi:hypothetical protein